MSGGAFYGTTWDTGCRDNPADWTVFKVNTDGAGHTVLKTFTGIDCLLMLLVRCAAVIFAARKIITLANKANLDKKAEESVEDKVATIPIPNQ